jgi:hypothetical protein
MKPRLTGSNPPSRQTKPATKNCASVLTSFAPLRPGRRTRIWWLTALGAGALLLLTAIPAHAITYGVVDTTHTYVGAEIAQFSNGALGVCSGDLVSPRVFLSAGHCAAWFASNGVPPSRVWVTFDTNIFPSGPYPSCSNPCTLPGFTPPAPDWLAVSSYLADPLFTGYNCPGGCLKVDVHDLSVFVLASSETSVGYAHLAPIGLLDQLLLSGSLTTMEISKLGYGQDQTGQLTAQRQMSQGLFVGLLAHWLNSQDTNASGSGGICGGDSGGPNLVTVGGVQYLVATNTLTLQLCGAGVDSSYRVDTTSAQSFISEEIAANP